MSLFFQKLTDLFLYIFKEYDNPLILVPLGFVVVYGAFVLFFRIIRRD